MKLLLTFVLLLLAVICFADESCVMTISPNNGNRPYIMNVGQTTVFNATASATLNNKTETGKLDGKALWEFSKFSLEKVSGTNSSITLKAVRPGSVQLRTKGYVLHKKCEAQIQVRVTP